MLIYQAPFSASLPQLWSGWRVFLGARELQVGWVQSHWIDHLDWLWIHLSSFINIFSYVFHIVPSKSARQRKSRPSQWWSNSVRVETRLRCRILNAALWIASCGILTSLSRIARSIAKALSVLDLKCSRMLSLKRRTLGSCKNPPLPPATNKLKNLRMASRFMIWFRKW